MGSQEEEILLGLISGGGGGEQDREEAAKRGVWRMNEEGDGRKVYKKETEPIRIGRQISHSPLPLHFVSSSDCEEKKNRSSSSDTRQTCGIQSIMAPISTLLPSGSWWLYASLLLICCLSFTATRRRYFHPLSHVPGPFLWSISNLPILYHNGIREGQLMHVLPKLHAKYGTFSSFKPFPNPSQPDQKAFTSKMTKDSSVKARVSFSLVTHNP